MLLCNSSARKLLATPSLQQKCKARQLELLRLGRDASFKCLLVGAWQTASICDHCWLQQPDW